MRAVPINISSISCKLATREGVKETCELTIQLNVFAVEARIQYGDQSAFASEAP
ncbi:hypothetical protein ALQ03_103326 [Pseudomonas savastanoi pv. glycinea]|uniref:Uncharacterized protein n=1 Tax=Pseudomonas savastanoi pv. glycinea TaxID=318 RepID=A0A0P9SF95_PSESG|nr:hypothetical protein PsgRace4_17973 [Pseudomonas savastanoi pv. glycinea str. race 4]KPC28077.1 Uncharacterized protein AC497_0669 [Pseudomonas savastanoi pv. glycinea]KPX50065.1 hypothetical protein ALO37_103075 [Pseudomonas savastanoi pv. glycinea]RMN09694.1 hypothetical protein ALQ67_103927 [Pseudomonas savastanoi pv. glycinea]RMO42092.1 hypothetical protein ALQ41_103216 [Pseudomonas savastanoi pv. glycinea]